MLAAVARKRVSVSEGCTSVDTIESVLLRGSMPTGMMNTLVLTKPQLPIAAYETVEDARHQTYWHQTVSTMSEIG